ncbi:hypothetical protein [Maribacter sp. 2307ULW6-5]|uniref:hypothetical protein n=1 Tax=Maribacter sp. 2307ULW6-5 TaxID=3386275 RepID=UPI0039BCC647
MIKILRYTEYLWLFMAIFSVYRIYTDWNVDRDNAYLFVFFGLMGVGMFLFRRKYRKRFEKRKEQEQNNS